MKKLSERNELLLLMGAKTTGSFKEAFEYYFEQWYVKDADIMKKFAAYLDDEIGGAGSSNINGLFLAFKYPDNKVYQEFAQQTKARIEDIRSRTK